MYAGSLEAAGRGRRVRLIPETIAPEFDHIVNLTLRGAQWMLSSAVAENACCGALFLGCQANARQLIRDCPGGHPLTRRALL